MKAIALAAVLALPASADGPVFRIGIGCEGSLPALIQIEAMRPGVTQLTLKQMMAVCVGETPEKSRWRFSS